MPQRKRGEDGDDHSDLEPMFGHCYKPVVGERRQIVRISALADEDGRVSEDLTHMDR
jgi:hypothetical protein